jgi:hypothetical protein
MRETTTSQYIRVKMERIKTLRKKKIMFTVIVFLRRRGYGGAD